MSEETARRRRGQIYVALAAVAWSTAGVLQRQLTLDTATQVAGRAAFALAGLLAYVAVVDRGRVLQAWKAGPETVALRRQLEAMSDGGVYAITMDLQLIVLHPTTGVELSRVDLRRKPGGLVDYDEVMPHFREASWEEALDLVAEV